MKHIKTFENYVSSLKEDSTQTGPKAKKIAESLMSENSGEYAMEEYERVKSIVDKSRESVQDAFEEITELFNEIDSDKEAKKFIIALGEFKSKWNIADANESVNRILYRSSRR
jgi:hypothetical protein